MAFDRSRHTQSRCFRFRSNGVHSGDSIVPHTNLSRNNDIWSPIETVSEAFALEDMINSSTGPVNETYQQITEADVNRIFSGLDDILKEGLGGFYSLLPRPPPPRSSFPVVEPG